MATVRPPATLTLLFVADKRARAARYAMLCALLARIGASPSTAPAARKV